MTLSHFKTKTSFEVENISTHELDELRAREMEEEFEFDEIKKYVKFHKKLTNV